MKTLIKISLVVLILGLSSFTTVIGAVNSNASHVAVCATKMGGQHVATCAQSMDRGVSACATMKPCHNN